MVSGIKWGVIFGVAVYLAQLGSLAVENALEAHSGPNPTVTEHPVLLIPICFSIFVLVFAFSAAGFYTGRETAMAQLGALAGVVTLIVQYVLGQAGTLLVGAGAHIQVGGQPAVNPAAQAASYVVSALLALGLAASIGWLGGRPGASRSPRRTVGTTTANASVLPDGLRHDE